MSRLLTDEQMAECKQCPYCRNGPIGEGHVDNNYWFACDCGELTLEPTTLIDIVGQWNRLAEEVIKNYDPTPYYLDGRGPPASLLEEAKEHGLVPGGEVFRVHFDNGNTALRYYDTAASWDKEIFKCRVTRERWDGEERVSFYNGD